MVATSENQTDSTTEAPTSDTMRLDELARGLGISVKRAYELASSNDLPLPVIRVGRQYRFSKHLYDRLMAGEYNKPKKEE